MFHQAMPPSLVPGRGRGKGGGQGLPRETHSLPSRPAFGPRAAFAHRPAFAPRGAARLFPRGAARARGWVHRQTPLRQRMSRPNRAVTPPAPSAPPAPQEPLTLGDLLYFDLIDMDEDVDCDAIQQKPLSANTHVDLHLPPTPEYPDTADGGQLSVPCPAGCSQVVCDQSTQATPNTTLLSRLSRPVIKTPASISVCETGPVPQIDYWATAGLPTLETVDDSSDVDEVEDWFVSWRESTALTNENKSGLAETVVTTAVSLNVSVTTAVPTNLHSRISKERPNPSSVLAAPIAPPPTTSSVVHPLSRFDASPAARLNSDRTRPAPLISVVQGLERSAENYHFSSDRFQKFGVRSTALPPVLVEIEPSDLKALDTSAFDPDRFLIPRGMPAFTTESIRIMSAYHEYQRTTTRRIEVIPANHNWSRLQNDVIASWCSAEPSRQQYDAINQLLEKLEHAINYSTPTYENPQRDRYEIEVFGSKAWGGGTRSGEDVDLVIIDRLIPQGYMPCFWTVRPGDDLPVRPPSRRPWYRNRNGRPATTPVNVPKLYSMPYLARILFNLGLNNVQAISSANTPIVKFHSDGFQCDINMNDLGGWYNSQLIFAYCNISPHVFRPMVHVLKIWAKSHRVNNPSGNGDIPTMSSYCLTLMAIAYLQHIGVLPNLQAGVPVPEILDHADTENCEHVVWTSWGRYQGVKAHIWFNRHPPPHWRGTDVTAEQAIRGFFSFFSTDHSVRDRIILGSQAVSILNGGIMKRAFTVGEESSKRNSFRRTLEGLHDAYIKEQMKEYDVMLEEKRPISRMGTGNGDIQPKAWGEKVLVVQDPFLWEKNCAAGMSKKGLDRFFEAVNRTHFVLQMRPNPTLADILGA